MTPEFDTQKLYDKFSDAFINIVTQDEPPPGMVLAALALLCTTVMGAAGWSDDQMREAFDVTIKKRNRLKGKLNG